MKISIELDNDIYSFETDKERSIDLYHIILHFKGVLLGMVYDLDKIDGCFDGAKETKFIPQEKK